MVWVALGMSVWVIHLFWRLRKANREIVALHWRLADAIDRAACAERQLGEEQSGAGR